MSHYIQEKILSLRNDTMTFQIIMLITAISEGMVSLCFKQERMSHYTILRCSDTTTRCKMILSGTTIRILSKNLTHGRTQADCVMIFNPTVFLKAIP